MKQLPKYADLLDPKIFKDDELKSLLNSEPNKAWLKKNKFANDAEYVPIDKVEFLLDSIFKNWKIEVLSATIQYESAVVSVRVHFTLPDGTWSFHDGCYGEPFKRNTEKKYEEETSNSIESAIISEKDLAKRISMIRVLRELKDRPVKQDAIKTAFPIAKSMAIKDACDHIGRIFGRDLNRKDALQFDTTFTPSTNPTNQIQNF